MRILITLLSILFFAPFTSSAVYAKNYSGNISINLGECSAYDCQYLITFESSETNSQELSPNIKWLILDCDNNTIKEATTYFNTILPGKKQRKTLNVSFRDMFEPDGGPVTFVAQGAKSGMVTGGLGKPVPLILNADTWTFCLQ